jgi:hypothetical protein
MVAANRLHVDEFIQSDLWQTRIANQDHGQDRMRSLARVDNTSNALASGNAVGSTYDPLRQPLGYLVALATIALPVAWQWL